MSRKCHDMKIEFMNTTLQKTIVKDPLSHPVRYQTIYITFTIFYLGGKIYHVLFSSNQNQFVFRKIRTLSFFAFTLNMLSIPYGLFKFLLACILSHYLHCSPVTLIFCILCFTFQIDCICFYVQCCSLGVIC